MTNEHTQFCLAHACGRGYEDAPNWCPYADEIRRRQGYILPSRCEEMIKLIEHPEQNTVQFSTEYQALKRSKSKKKSDSYMPNEAYRLDMQQV